jgi:hypothetical protein
LAGSRLSAALGVVFFIFADRNQDSRIVRHEYENVAPDALWQVL